MRRLIARPSLVDATFACRSFLLRFRNRRTLRTSRVSGMDRPDLLSSVGGKLRLAGLDHRALSKLLPCEACSCASRIFIAKSFERRAESAHPPPFFTPARLILFGVAAGRCAARRQIFFGPTNPFAVSPPLLHRGTTLVTGSGDRRCYT